MRRKDIVNTIAKELRAPDGRRYSRNEINDIIEYFVNSMKMALRQHDKVIIRGFGTFAVWHRNSKPVDTVRTRERVMSEGRDHVHFKQSVNFDVNKLF